MKIVFFIRAFLGHTETFVYDQIMHLSKGNEVKIFCLETKNQTSFPIENLVRIPYKKSWLHQKFDKALFKLNWKLNQFHKPFSNNLNEILGTFKADIIHCHFGLQAFFLIDNLVSIDVPIFVTFHGYDASLIVAQSKVYRRRLKALFQKDNIFPIFISQSLKSNLIRYNIQSKNSKVVYLGVDTDFFSRKQYLTSDDFIFLQVASFVEKKGHALTLRAFRLFLEANPGFVGKLNLVGIGSLMAEMKQLVSELRLENYVVFKGRASRTEVKQCMEEANAFIHHSITSRRGDTEGIPTVIKEAMAMELPIISTYHSGIPELVSDGENGFLVPEGDLIMYAQRMRDCLKYGYLKENRDKIVNLFEEDKQNKKLYAHFIKCINSKTTIE